MGITRQLRGLSPRVVAIFTAVLSQSCAAVNPNPNTGARTVDLMFSRGDCDGAMKAAEPAAQRGEPWALFRMGALLIDKKCPNTSPQNVPAALDWLGRAACYESKSAWERGSLLAVGATGFFNSRASSTSAAKMLAGLYLQLDRPALAMYFVQRVRDQYSEDEDAYKELSIRLDGIQSRMSPELLEAVRRENTNVCTLMHP